MAVEPVDVVAYTLTIELPATASFDCVTLDRTTSSLTSQFTTSWPTTITDNATDYHSTIFPKPTGACFVHPTYLHLHWTNRQSTPTFPPQPPTPSRPSRISLIIRTSSTGCICRPSSTRPTSNYDIHDTGYLYNSTPTARHVDPYRQKNPHLQNLLHPEDH